MGLDVSVKHKKGKEVISLELERKLCKVQIYSRKDFLEEIGKGLEIEGETPKTLSEDVKAVVLITYADEPLSSNLIKFVTDGCRLTFHTASCYAVSE